MTLSLKDLMGKIRHSKISFAELTFYLTWLLALGLEGFIVHGLRYVARLMAPEQYSLWLTAGLFFGIVLTPLSLWLYRQTQPLAELHGPFLRLTNWSMQRRGVYQAIGFVVSTLVAASSGVAIVLKSRGTRHGVSLVLLSCAIFSAFWVPIFVEGFSVFARMF